MRKRDAIEARLRNLQSKFSRFYAQALSRKDLTIPQFSLLMLVIDEGPLKMNEVAEKLYLTSPSVTNLVDRLEVQNLVRRRLHPRDRRSNLIEATPKGRRVISEIRRQTVGRLAKKLDEFPDKEIETVMKFYETIEKAIDEILTRQRQSQK